jgi:hypothetical protein
MFRRLVFESWVSIFTLTAFVTALSIYLCCTWRALRMPRAERERFERLPLDD